MIALLRNALNLLDEQGREEVLQFLISQQNTDGGFRDRGGRSDLYYSLFGGLMLRAWGMESEEQRTETGEPLPELGEGTILKLKQFITQQSNADVPGFIEKCCLVLLQKELKTRRNSQLKALISLGKSFWKERRSINLSYRSFVLFLTLDAVLPLRRILKVGAKKMLARTTIDQHSPCSEVAARVFLQRMMNHNGSEDQELLKSFACEPGGFKAFMHLDNADLLSTAVALFALNYSGSDLRLLKPACLNFIGQNFSNGAFLSGDGDLSADAEYTFYGLLALGVLDDSSSVRQLKQTAKNITFF
jgi:prenyltransferase beta subunit